MSDQKELESVLRDVRERRVVVSQAKTILKEVLKSEYRRGYVEGYESCKTRVLNYLIDKDMSTAK